MDEAADCVAKRTLAQKVDLLALQYARDTHCFYPLKLWLDDADAPAKSNWFEVIEGETHYVPPQERRASLAWDFLYNQAPFPHEVDTPSHRPSVGQLRNLGKIVAVARKT